MDPKTRRDFLGVIGAAALVGACGDAVENVGDTDGGSDGGGGSQGGAGGVGGQGGEGGLPDGGAGGAGGQGGAGPLECTATDVNGLGPYYRANAPFRTDFTEPNMPGTRITVSGRVLDPDCQPIADALVDVWQADDSGDYDNDGQNDPPGGEYILRGRLNADGAGVYSFRTVIPGHYLNGASFRPAHFHVTVTAPGFVPLTTQLYFDGDPYNATDGGFLESLALTLADDGGEKTADFDFVLQPS